ncbi:hypothetical protein BAUCODRAFT_254058 [Baudoinia panamericana UAMH 10762]|uniref:Uncharacterized protein n=1 Tax=Baudoinia panamericana (strain UAMH 10762) TaxID=717646 RepID=M2N0Y3_BAUPA|nr:uncharacterized protein BAUCODRAFT_254058 [Baudoinia panamericana UAMH 10762]EMC92564.1 hypothetical protein BAUCODRAFT_254058 [Baudoinia panamericana UAMH 10762]
MRCMPILTRLRLALLLEPLPHRYVHLLQHRRQRQSRLLSRQRHRYPRRTLPRSDCWHPYSCCSGLPAARTGCHTSVVALRTPRKTSSAAAAGNIISPLGDGRRRTSDSRSRRPPEAARPV